MSLRGMVLADTGNTAERGLGRWTVFFAMSLCIARGHIARRRMTSNLAVTVSSLAPLSKHQPIKETLTAIHQRDR